MNARLLTAFFALSLCCLGIGCVRNVGADKAAEQATPLIIEGKGYRIEVLRVVYKQAIQTPRGYEPPTVTRETVEFRVRPAPPLEAAAIPLLKIGSHRVYSWGGGSVDEVLLVEYEPKRLPEKGRIAYGLTTTRELPESALTDFELHRDEIPVVERD